MIRKLQSDGYLKRYDKMTAAERQAYKDRVGQWLRSEGRLLAGRVNDFDARLQNVLMVSVGWNDAECQAFEEGARLLSALINTADTWLPELLYVKAAKRAINNMIKRLSPIPSLATPLGRGVDTAVSQKPEMKPSPAPNPSPKGEGSKVTTADAAAVAVSTPIHDKEEQGGGSLLPVRPKHIDQYVHLLPKKTQERAAKVKDLLRELDNAREKMRLLMDDPTASAADREAWAKKATTIDNRVKSIYRELDAEWEKLVKSGRVVVDDLGNARCLTPDPSPQGEGNSKPEKAELSSEQKARRRELRKWLTDTRRGNGNAREARMEKWRENWKEYLTLEPLDAALKDEKIIEATKHYGINLEKLKTTN